MAIAVTMGDPAGVGPELILKAFLEGSVASEFLVVGDLDVLAACNETLRFRVPLRSAADPRDLRAGEVNVLDARMLTRSDVVPGRISRRCGEAARTYVETAVRRVLAGDAGAMVTLPVSKEAVRLSEPSFRGHTELIAGLCGAGGVVMMLHSPRLTVTHVSTHVSLRDAIHGVTKERVLEVIRLTAGALRMLGAQSRIAVAGLNPHAGEGGAFGAEEQAEIAPAVAAARAEGFDTHGPLPPDAVFRLAMDGRFDAVVCMYHDQGHIPMKLLDFQGAVNVTIGLPIVRTSVDHGTAFDIAWKGVASTGSYAAAFALARRLCGEDRP
jgi:4-phospho-D-threonate 3-dehydrogenase / 4-phospho-D-erythronate 3-dehydrogenase